MLDIFEEETILTYKQTRSNWMVAAGCFWKLISLEAYITTSAPRYNQYRWEWY